MVGVEDAVVAPRRKAAETHGAAAVSPLRAHGFAEGLGEAVFELAEAFAKVLGIGYGNFLVVILVQHVENMTTLSFLKPNVLLTHHLIPPAHIQRRVEI